VLENVLKEDFFLLKISEHLYMSFAAMLHLSKVLSSHTAYAKRRKFSYFPCRHTNSNTSLMDWQFILPLKTLKKSIQYFRFVSITDLVFLLSQIIDAGTTAHSVYGRYFSLCRHVQIHTDAYLAFYPMLLVFLSRRGPLSG
jgi:hypothetical protein